MEFTTRCSVTCCVMTPARAILSAKSASSSRIGSSIHSSGNFVAERAWSHFSATQAPGSRQSWQALPERGDTDGEGPEYAHASVSGVVDVEDQVPGIQPADAPKPGQRVTAPGTNFAGSCPCRTASSSRIRASLRDGEIHRTPDRGNGVRCSGVPVGEVSTLADLKRPEHTRRDGAASWREGVGVERGTPRAWHRNLACIGEIRVIGVSCRGASHAEHAVLGVQHHLGGGSRKP